MRPNRCAIDSSMTSPICQMVTCAWGQLFRVRGEPKKAAEHLRLAAAVARSADDDPEMPLSLEAEADSLDPPTS